MTGISLTTPVAQQTATLSADGVLLAVHVPMTFRKRGGRKMVVAPDGSASAPHPHAWPARRSNVDQSLLTTLAQAFRWQTLLDQGQFATISDLARAEKLDHSIVSRTLRLTLLAPDIVEAILDGTQPIGIERQKLLHGFPIEWEKQRRMDGA